MILKIRNNETAAGKETILQGKILSPGIGIGTAIIEEMIKPIPKNRIAPQHVPGELEKFNQALLLAHDQLKVHIESTHSLLDEDLVRIFTAHEMMLKDIDFNAQVKRRISEELKNTKWAIQSEVDKLVERLERMRDPYLQARAEDIRDLGQVLLESISRNGKGPQQDYDLLENPVIITRNLYPSFAMKAKSLEAAGFVTESLLTQAHAAILLKGLGIPAVGAVKEMYNILSPEDEIIVDALEGKVIICPSPATKTRYEKLRTELLDSRAGRKRQPRKAVSTGDGTPVRVMANIEHPSQIPLAIQNGMEGIGLFRTEFIVLERGTMPEEEEQVEIYRSILGSMGREQIVIRTFDIGGDKTVTGINRCTGMNPALGVRGIRRHLLRFPEELKVQFRSILKAADGAPVSVMFPMVTHVDDVIEVKKIISSVISELKKGKTRVSKNIRIGSMIEVPSAAINTAAILEEVDYISVGSNDLLQYFVGADRNNQEVLSYYNPAHPAFQWLLRFIISEAKRVNRAGDVTICGEIACSPDLIPLIIEAGYRSLSVSPVDAEKVRAAVADTVITGRT